MKESIHLAINNLATKKTKVRKCCKYFEEMTSQIKDVKKKFIRVLNLLKKDDKINLAHEFIRMIIQNKYTD